MAWACVFRARGVTHILSFFFFPSFKAVVMATIKFVAVMALAGFMVIALAWNRLPAWLKRCALFLR